jgi:hypothetical protein
MSSVDSFSGEWRKSSRSSGGPNCVEVAWVWRKSSRSGGGPNCVEVASDGVVTAVRDSKHPSGPVLAFPISAWVEFVRR